MYAIYMKMVEGFMWMALEAYIDNFNFIGRSLGLKLALDLLIP